MLGDVVETIYVVEESEEDDGEEVVKVSLYSTGQVPLTDSFSADRCKEIRNVVCKR